MNPLTSVLALVVGLSAVGSAGPASAQVTTAVAHPTSSCCLAEMDRAHALLEAGKSEAAHRLYHAIARNQVAAGEFPGEALWQAAEISHARGRYLRAARELDQVAGHAADAGRPSFQVRALLAAATFYHEANRTELARARLARVTQLVTSPDVSQDTRAWVQARLRGDAATG